MRIFRGNICNFKAYSSTNILEISQKSRYLGCISKKNRYFSEKWAVFSLIFSKFYQKWGQLASFLLIVGRQKSLEFARKVAISAHFPRIWGNYCSKMRQFAPKTQDFSRNPTISCRPYIIKFPPKIIHLWMILWKFDGITAIFLRFT